MSNKLILLDTKNKYEMFKVNELFSPIDMKSFMSEYFEKKHLIIKRNDSSFYNKLISITDIDEVLFSQKLHAPSFRLVDSKIDTFPEFSTFCKKDTHVIDPVKFIKGFSEGHTLAMAGFQDIHYNMRSFCHELEDLFGHPFQTNFYLTPKHSKGFAPHWDSHDVIVLQVSGKKYWKIYENSIKLADKNLQFDPKGFEAGKVIDEFYLEEGDLLYIPRGLTHDAYTEESHSLHITTGMVGFTWSQYLIESVLNLTRSNPKFREFIPLGALSDLYPMGYNNTYKELLSSLEEELSLKHGLNRFSIQRKALQDSCAKNQLKQVMDLDKLQITSIVKVRENISYAIKRNDNTVRIVFGDTYVEFPDYCENVITSLLNSKTGIKIKNLEGDLDNSGKIVLVKKLIKEGLITTIQNKNNPIDSKELEAILS